MQRVAVGVLLAVSGALSAAPSLAGDGRPFRLALETPDGCPDREAFRNDVMSRSDRIREASQDEPAHSFRLRVTRGPLVGRLEITDPEGTRTNRALPGEVCNEIVAAAALIAALTLDPEASAAPSALLQPSESDASDPTAPTAPPPKPEPPAPPPETPSVRRPPPSAVSAPKPAPSRWVWGGGGGGFVVRGIAPDPAFGFHLFAEGERKRASAMSPSFAAELLRARSPTSTVGAGRASFRWLAGRARVCPVRYPPRSRIVLRPCATFTAGVLRGRGRGLDGARGSTATWVAGGAQGLFRVRLVSSLAVGATGGIELPFGRDRFFFAPDETIHEIPAVGFEAGLHLAVRTE